MIKVGQFKVSKSVTFGETNGPCESTSWAAQDRPELPSRYFAEPQLYNGGLSIAEVSHWFDQ